MYNEKLYNLTKERTVVLDNETVIQGGGEPRPKSVHLPTKPGNYYVNWVDGMLVLVHEDIELTKDLPLKTHRKTAESIDTLTVATLKEEVVQTTSYNNTTIIWIHKREKQVDVIILDSLCSIFGTPSKEKGTKTYEINYHIKPIRNGQIKVYVEISEFENGTKNIYQHWSANVHWNYTTKKLNMLIDEARQTLEGV